LYFLYLISVKKSVEPEHYLLFENWPTHHANKTSPRL